MIVRLCGRFVGPSLALALGMTAACLIELDHTIACGDGHVDERAGEVCDPLLEDSFADACIEHHGPGVGGQARCDPITCQLDLSECLTCGNGRLDLGEECDVALAGDDLLQPGYSNCRGLDPPPGFGRYGSGIATCLPNCTLDRSTCSWCGNDVLDLNPPEPCDGSNVDVHEQRKACLSHCVDAGMGFLLPNQVVCNLECNGTCSGFVEPEGGLECCLPAGELRRPDIECCAEGPHDERCRDPRIGG